MQVETIQEWENPAETPCATLNDELSRKGKVKKITLGEMVKFDLKEETIVELLISAGYDWKYEFKYIERTNSITVEDPKITVIEWKGMIDLYIGDKRARSIAFAKRLLKCGK